MSIPSHVGITGNYMVVFVIKTILYLTITEMPVNTIRSLIKQKWMID